MASEAGVTVARKCIRFRHVQTFLLFLGVALAVGMRINMSMVIVDMTASPRSGGNGTQDLYVEYKQFLDWPISTQGIILSSFIVGYAISQTSGYFLASKFGAKLMVTVGVAVSAILSAFIPLGAYDGGWILICLGRAIQGMAQGAMIPAIHHLIENWIPFKNRSLIETLTIVCGLQFSTVLHFLLSGYIIKYWGWEMTFFINFVTGVVWSVIYVILGSSSAEISKYISEDEKNYIKTSLLQDIERKNLKMPWHALWTSLPVLALVLASCAQQWGLWTFTTMMPIFLNSVYNVDIDLIGVILAVPFIAMFMMMFVFRWISNCIIKNNYLSATATRKVCNAIGFLGPAICLVVISYLLTDLKLTATLFIVFMGLNAAQFSGFMTSHEEMAPNFSDTLKRTTIGFADILSMFAPLTAGIMLEDQQNPCDWRSVFNLTASLYIATGFFYVIFGTSVKQHWNDVDSYVHSNK